MNTYKSLNITGVNTGGGANPPYNQAFVVADWSLNGSVYEIDILESTHGLGANLGIHVYELVGGNYNEVVVDTEIDATGNITISISSSTDLRFDGKIIIIGE